MAILCVAFGKPANAPFLALGSITPTPSRPIIAMEAFLRILIMKRPMDVAPILRIASLPHTKFFKHPNKYVIYLLAVT
jgi:hypothetical protein